ncbi:hypothetical protein [uncultured Legionella sp.]|uniref:hypothetical protein n=1 Tax=uncultured Legionella sp. TaxID=210934 RepID=UPI002635CEF3|nr:hypothetical protein [uncultured Legionella sp.]
MRPISAKYNVHDTMVSTVTGKEYPYVIFTIRLPNKNEQYVKLWTNDDYTQIFNVVIGQGDKLYFPMKVEQWMSVLLSSWKNSTNEMVQKDLYTFIYEAGKVDCIIKNISDDLENDFEQTEPSETLVQKVASQYSRFF